MDKRSFLELAGGAARVSLFPARGMADEHRKAVAAAVGAPA